LWETVATAVQQGQRVGCLLHHLDVGDAIPNVTVTRIAGSVSDYAQALFAALRALDACGVEVILVEAVPEEGIGVAVMDRLRRAASPGAP
jgi:L-threonylcarbamoyladenylate synthase